MWQPFLENSLIVVGCLICFIVIILAAFWVEKYPKQFELSLRFKAILRRVGGGSLVVFGVLFPLFFWKFFPFLLDAFYQFMVSYPSFTSLMSVLGAPVFLLGLFFSFYSVVKGIRLLKLKEVNQ